MSISVSLGNILTSRRNPRIRELSDLRKSDYRRESGFFIIEGTKEFSLALRSGISIKEIYFCPEFFDKGKKDELLDETRAKGISAYEVSSKVYEKIAFGHRQEGILAVARQPRHALKDLNLSVHPLLIAVEHIEKPGNLGAILRTADASGAEAVIVADEACELYNPNVVRASLGALFTTAVVKAQAEELIPWLREKNIQIICACVQAKNVYTSVDFKKASAIILGNEEKGLSAFWKDNSDCQVSIPMTGKADSLNVSVSAAILLFEAVRQRSL